MPTAILKELIQSYHGYLVHEQQHALLLVDHLPDGIQHVIAKQQEPEVTHQAHWL